MKANYHNSLNNKPHTKRIILVALGLALVVILFRPWLGNVASFANGSVFSVSNWLFTSSGTIPSYFRDRKMLQDEITELKSKIASYDGDRKTLANLVAENQQLLSMVSGTSSPRLLSNIIGRPPQLPFDALLIDRGSNDGIKENAVVYINGDKAVGLIARAYPDSALVALASSPGIESSVFVIGPNVYATAVGEGGGVLKVNVPQGIHLDVGNLVVVPALGSGVYGSVEEVISIPAEPVQNGYVTVGTPIQTLRAVTVSLDAIDTITFEAAAAAVTETINSQLIVDVPINHATSSATSTVISTPSTTSSE